MALPTSAETRAVHVRDMLSSPVAALLATVLAGICAILQAQVVAALPRIELIRQLSGLIPGIFFALAILATVRRPKRMSVIEGALFVIASTAAWVIGYGAAANPRSFVGSAIKVVPSFIYHLREDNVRGMLGGVVGAAILAVAFILIYRIRDWRRVLGILILVPATGLAIGWFFLDIEMDWVAYGLWQGGVGFVIALLNPGWGSFWPDLGRFEKCGVTHGARDVQDEGG
jgi:small-conductance mechanosensitive channel